MDGVCDNMLQPAPWSIFCPYSYGHFQGVNIYHNGSKRHKLAKWDGLTYKGW